MSNKKDQRTASGYPQVNDVLLLEWGTPVQWPHCPRYLLDGSRPYEEGTVDKLIQIGVPVERPVPMNMLRNRLSGKISELFDFYRIHLDQPALDHFILDQVPDPKPSSVIVPAGLYVITDIVPVRDGQKTILKTYKPEPGAPEYSIYFYQGFEHVTNIAAQRVVSGRI